MFKCKIRTKLENIQMWKFFLCKKCSNAKSVQILKNLNIKKFKCKKNWKSLGRVASVSPFWCLDAKRGKVVLLELSGGICMVGHKLVAIFLLELVSIYLSYLHCRSYVSDWWDVWSLVFYGWGYYYLVWYDLLTLVSTYSWLFVSSCCTLHNWFCDLSSCANVLVI
jgi:hypothetical protein